MYYLDIFYIYLIHSHTGTDASEVFEEIGRHTAQAREHMQDFCIGVLKQWIT